MVQQIGPLGRRAFLRTRARYSWMNTESVAALEAPTVRVIDAFTSGGAQVAGGQHSKTLTLGSDLDYVRGNHTLALWHADRYRQLAFGRPLQLSRHLHVREPGGL